MRRWTIVLKIWLHMGNTKIEMGHLRWTIRLFKLIFIPCNPFKKIPNIINILVRNSQCSKRAHASLFTPSCRMQEFLFPNTITTCSPPKKMHYIKMLLKWFLLILEAMANRHISFFKILQRKTKCLVTSKDVNGLDSGWMLEHPSPNPINFGSENVIWIRFDRLKGNLGIWSKSGRTGIEFNLI